MGVPYYWQFLKLMTGADSFSTNWCFPGQHWSFTMWEGITSFCVTFLKKRNIQISLRHGHLWCFKSISLQARNSTNEFFFVCIRSKYCSKSKSTKATTGHPRINCWISVKYELIGGGGVTLSFLVLFGSLPPDSKIWIAMSLFARTERAQAVFNNVWCH